MTPVLVALGAGVGAVLRYLTATLLDDRFPWGTWAVNVTGSFVLGALVGAEVGGTSLALLGTGFCGGLTTYSSFAVQTHARGPRWGASYALVTLVVALGACALGFVVGGALAQA